MTQLPALRADPFLTDVQDLARAYHRANGPVMTVVNRLGGGLEKQMQLIPAPLRAQIEQTVVVALTAAHGVAGMAGEGPGSNRSTSLAVLATGAAGGAGGLVTAIAELPFTITLFLQAIRAEAIRAGFDPAEPGIRAACLEVFAAGSPVQQDDGVNTAFLSARVTLSGAAMQKLIATIAPRLAATMGQKLAAQAVPVLGALSGAALNAAFLAYYREMARIRFALMRMAEVQGGEAVVVAFSAAVAAPRISKS